MRLLAWISICWGRSLDWGSLAEWVGGVGTAGALLLGLRILQRDHASSEKAQIDQVGWWYGPTGLRYGWIMTNYSTLPAHVSIEPADPDRPISQMDSSKVGTFPPEARAMSPDGLTVPPGETFMFFDFLDKNTEGGSRDAIKWMVVMDNAGRKWEHKFGTGWVPASKRARRAAGPKAT
ncbi:hypothetical protein [Kribbella sindirgiensis]|uniref:Uncharacterized protein n=1 Tax=Kribbella sindirgiensis TaxID=1124744 RepID=A0A4R0I552_9ACTN|nr:hypothetical protein [Kribbella sindirgiensis]TCC19993.1 hypothetical protein E0H50_37865 [Kribbella sindirgiensis]